MPFRLVCIAVLLLPFLGAPVTYAQESGLLLGLRAFESAPAPLPYYIGAPDSLGASAYRTLLITEGSDTIALAGQIEGLLVPRAGEMWRAGVKRSVYNNWVEDFVWAAPVGQSPYYIGIDAYNGEYCEGHRTQRLLYAGPTYLALSQRSAGYCEGAAHPWNYNTLAVIPIDSTAHLGLPISEVLGEAARATFVQSAEHFLDSLSSEERSRYVQRPDEANWTLYRSKGRWATRARLGGASEAEQGVFVDLPLDVALPDTIASGAQALQPSWPAVKEFAPDARDAFTSPQGDLLVILHPQRLTAHRLRDAIIGTAVLEVPVPANSTAIAVRWGQGTQLRTWERALQRDQDTLHP